MVYEQKRASSVPLGPSGNLELFSTRHGVEGQDADVQDMHYCMCALPAGALHLTGGVQPQHLNSWPRQRVPREGTAGVNF